MNAISNLLIRFWKTKYETKGIANLKFYKQISIFPEFCELIYRQTFRTFYRDVMKYSFLHGRKPILAPHSGIFSFLKFGFNLELHHNLWGYITIFQQSDF